MPKDKSKSLPAKHRIERFCQEYCIDSNATRSATAAGYSAKSACPQGSRLLRNGKVSKRIAEIQAEIATRNNVTVDRVLKEMARIAFFDPRAMFLEDGTPKAITELDDDTAAAIAGLEVEERFEGRGANRKLVGTIKKYKVSDKGTALSNLARHLGMYNKDTSGGESNALKQLFDAINAGGRKSLVQGK